MSFELDLQLREYCRQMEEQQGALTFEDVLERSGELPTVRPLGHQTSTRRRWIAAAASVAVVILIAVVSGRSLSTSDRVAPPADLPAPTTTVAPRTDYPESGPVEAGTYRLEPSASLVVGVTLTMPQGWETQDGLPVAHKAPDEDAGFSFYTVEMISLGTCLRADGRTVGPTADDLAQALLRLDNVSATGPVDATIGGLPAQRVDLAVVDGFDPSGCNAPGGLQIWYSQPADNYFVLLDEHTASVYIFEVDGERQVFVTHVRNGATDEALAELQAITESIQIGS